MSLPELQAWFMTVMTAPGGLAHSQALAAQRHGLLPDQVLAPGPGASPAARMRVYADGYVLRLLDCLRADYPLLCKLLGDELFQFFARSYLGCHPPAAPSLYELGAGFADFLAASQAGQGGDALQLPVALARLERARIEAGRAPGTEHDAGALALSPLDLLIGHDLWLRAPGCLRLLMLETPILAYAESLAADRDPPPVPAPRSSLVAVTRKSYRIATVELSAWQYHLLSQLAEAGPGGAPVGSCLISVAQRADVTVDEVQAGLMTWLPGALAKGVLAPGACNPVSLAD